MGELALASSDVLDSPSPPELAALANREHALARQAGESMVEHAIKAGQALSEAKARVKHGEWLPWLEANFEASRQTAHRYMQVAANVSCVGHLEEPSLNKALQAVSGKDDQAVHYSSEKDDWATPADLFQALDAEFGFTLDVCASAANAKCERYYSAEQDGLSQEWSGTCWMNPPYGSAIGDWVKKADESAKQGAIVVALVPARTDTEWWWSHCRHHEVRFLKGRLRFGGAETGAPFPSAVVVFGPWKPKVIWWERGHDV